MTIAPRAHGPASRRLAPRRGARLGKYQLVGRLGEGGFSQVWKARDTIEAQWVALKIPHPTFPGSSEEEEILSEIRLSARLKHPHILRPKSADKIGMRYVVAYDMAIESLETRLGRRLGTARALSYTRQVLEGVAYAHRQKVIHRDLKPSNLLLYNGDHLRVADFGLARLAKHSMISATGSGTLLYLAPEQAHGYPCFASDVFSLGLLCYQMFTGVLPRWPFEWPFPKADVLERKVPQEIVRLLRKATQVEYRQRFHDACEMLERFEAVQPAVRRFLQPKARRRQPRRHGAARWRTIRFRECQRLFGKRLFLRFQCPDCHGPVSEHMRACPWCGLDELRYGEHTEFQRYCSRCEKGLRDEWRYCPWCWGRGFPEADGRVRADSRYDTSCPSCRKPMITGMRYCPWCHGKARPAARIDGLGGRCRRCKGSIAVEFWEYCPWCAAEVKR